MRFSSVPNENGRLSFPPHMGPVSGVLYQYNSDILNNYNFTAVIDLGYETIFDPFTGQISLYIATIALQADLYDNYIYYTNNKGEFNRYDTRRNRTELLIYGVSKFFIDDGWIYYTFWDGLIYRTKLESNEETEFIDFQARTAVYTPEPGYFIRDWNVKGGMIYIILSSDDSDDGDRILLRVNTGSSLPPQYFGN
jgi:hypothetical protein